MKEKRNTEDIIRFIKVHSFNKIKIDDEEEEKEENVENKKDLRDNINSDL